MNKPIRTMALFCGVLFALLLVNATYLQFWRGDSLSARDENMRVFEESFSRERGAILVDGEPVAESVKSDDRYKFQRQYRLPLRYAHVTGWFSLYSQSGIEKAQNELLSGQDDSLFVTRLVDLLGNEQPQGGNVELTINAKAQKAAYDGLLALGEDTQGAVVAIEPSTGKILAMVSTPSFDPNKLASHDTTAVQEYDDKLNADNVRQPKLNRAVSTTLPPGSTFKLVTAAAALEAELYDSDSQVPAGASYTLPNSSTSVGNATGSACNPRQVTLEYALMWSCNTTFLALADELGEQRLREQAEAFGFGDEALLDLPGVVASDFPAGQDRPQVALSGMGQASVRATPLQMAMVAAGIANNGEVMRPYLVDQLQSPDFESLDQTDPEVYAQAISAATARQLTDMMVAVVDDGTARSAAIAGIRVAGKTGTAERGGDRVNTAWFVSFAPADDPRVAVAVMVEDAGTSEVSGGGLAGPIARAVMEAVINR